jgi:hypothetical protein
MTSAIKRNPTLWRKIVQEIKSESTGGTKSGQWSARKAQIAVARYKSQGGTYVGPKRQDNSLVKWSNQHWRTKSGRASHITNERYLPEKAIQYLSSRDYASVSKLKLRDSRRGLQYSKMPYSISRKIKQFR